MRIRTIKPEFFKHDQLAELSPLCRILFVGLWCLADCEGRLEDRPARIKVEVLPYDKADTEAMLCELERGGFIERYQAQGMKLIQIVSFARHQRITGKESETPSRYPRNTGETPGKQPRNTGETPETTGNGRETEGKGNGKEGNGEIHSANSRAVLFYLNEKTGRSFRETDTNLATIDARLKEPGVTVEGVKQMISRQVLKWKDDPKMCDYLRPETLFNKTKFDGYYAAKDVPIPSGGKSTNADSGQIQETIIPRSL